MRCSSWCELGRRAARLAAAGLVGLTGIACDAGTDGAGGPGAPDGYVDTGPRPNVYVPPEGCSGPDEFRMLAWGEDQIQAVRPGCVHVPLDALASLRAACAETRTDPVWVDARRLKPGESPPCR